MSAKERINALKQPFSLEERIEKQRALRTKDSGIVKPHARGVASSAIRADGRIEHFAKTGLGMRIDPLFDSISFFSPRVYFHCDEVHFISSPKMYWDGRKINLKRLGTYNPVNYFNMATAAGPVFHPLDDALLSPVPHVSLERILSFFLD